MFAKAVVQALRRVCEASSQSEVARRTGVSQGRINSYLNGRSQAANMTLETLERLLPVVREWLPEESLAGMPFAELQEERSPYGAGSGGDPLLKELVTVWAGLPKSSRYVVLGAAHAEAEKGGGNGGGSSVSGVGRQAG